MKILHITNSYGGTDVYTNLYTAIDTISDDIQWVYVPLGPSSYNRSGNNMIDFNQNESKITYSKLLKSYHSYFYGAKISKCVYDIENKYDLLSIDLIHASTLCFDGAIAFEISIRYGIPYIVAVRNTDVNAYYKKLFWRRNYFYKILNHASKIIFISPKYKDNFLKNHVPEKNCKAIEEKMTVIPNGVNRLFLENRATIQKKISKQKNLLFVAAFYKEKGLIETIKAIESLRNKGYNLTFNAIGKGLPNRPHDKDYIQNVEKLVQGKNWVKLQPFMKPEEIIKEMRKSDIFVMVSSPETFGLVYVEALTQGLPIVYAKNQGFDGFYSEGIAGYSALAGNVESIALAIEKIIINYDVISTNISALNLEKDFKWKNIAAKYIDIYNKIVK